MRERKVHCGDLNLGIEDFFSFEGWSSRSSHVLFLQIWLSSQCKRVVGSTIDLDEESLLNITDINFQVNEKRC